MSMTIADARDVEVSSRAPGVDRVTGVMPRRARPLGHRSRLRPLCSQRSVDHAPREGLDLPPSHRFGFTCTLLSLGPGASARFNFAVRAPAAASPSALSRTERRCRPPPRTGPRCQHAQATTTAVSCTITSAGDIVATAGDDVICGSAGPDRIAAPGGNDIIFGVGGDDQLSGGNGNDVLLGGEGSDRLAGGDGDDQLFGGGAGIDRPAGGHGDDTLNAVDGAGDDYASGGEHLSGDICVVESGDFTAV